jgi:maltooligosyltrehalose synthase
MDDSGAGGLDDGDEAGSASSSPNLDSSMVDPQGRRASDVFKQAEELKSAKNKGRKRQAEDGKPMLVSVLARLMA